MDERSRRGPAAGVELDWRTGDLPPTEGNPADYERSGGTVRVYGDDEIQLTDSDDLLNARRDLDRRIQPKIDGVPQEEYDANLLFLARRKLDNAGPPSFHLDKYAGDFRGLGEFNHHEAIKRLLGIENIKLDLVYKQETDRDFMLEYFPHNYNSDNQPQALFSLRKPSDDYSLELIYRGDPQDFDGAPPRAVPSITAPSPATCRGIGLIPQAATPLPYGC